MQMSRSKPMPKSKERVELELYPRYDGKKELRCPHGVGHGGIHGCDGCCADESFKIYWDKIFGGKGKGGKK